MKAVFFERHGDINVLQYGDFSDPEVQSGWVTVKGKACSLNYLDIFSRRGMPGIRITLSSITGGDYVGEIAELGAGVAGWSVGQCVLVDPVLWDPQTGRPSMLGETCKGAMAEYCAVHHSQLISLPDNIADEDASCLPVAYGTSHRMLITRGQVTAGEKVFILGASGGISTSSLLIAKMQGAYVIAAAGSDEKCARLKELGADETINYSTTNFHEYCKKTTGTLFTGGGYDVVICSCPMTTALPNVCVASCTLGRLPCR